MGEFDKDTNVSSNEYINKADMWEAYENSKNDVDMAEQFERLPTIDIVHCKDCISKNGCILYGCTCDDDWYCADGERKK